MQECEFALKKFKKVYRTNSKLTISQVVTNHSQSRFLDEHVWGSLYFQKTLTCLRLLSVKVMVLQSQQNLAGLVKDPAK